MKRLLHVRSISKKLLLLVLATNLCTLLMAGAALLYYDFQEARAKTAAELSALANLLGQGSITALEFSDAKVASENLANLRAAKNVTAAAIYTSKGALFASYAREPAQARLLPARPGADGIRFNGAELTIFKSIANVQEPLGVVFVREQHDLSGWLRDYLAILGLVLLASLAFGLAISSRLQRWISGPVLAVTDVARQVMARHDYQLRAPKTTEDEVGQLADAFNGMLQTLEHEMAERNAAEQAVRTLNEDLERRVHERTAELEVANENLQVRTTEAESANRAKADFLANMSHEIRTPMNGILGLAYLLDRRHLDHESAEMVHKIRNAGRSLQAIINDILDFSKIEAGRLEIEHSPFRLVDVCDNLAAIMAANAGNKEIELAIAPPPHIGGNVLGDALRLEQILINLTGNAIKFTERGGVKVGMTLLSQDERIVRVRFAVSDTGIGIALDKQAHIFSAFSQADASTTRRFGGTGLGLTICRRLVEKMGGEIGVISTPGKGSEFWFTVPFAWVPDAEYAPPELAQLDILVADDSDIARENLVQTARSVGWNATMVDSGEAAIQKIMSRHAQHGHYDVMLVDWKMPGMDGMELAMRLRSTLHDTATPIVLMVTAFSQEELLRHPNIDCVDGVLSKPVTSSALYNGVANAMQRRGGALPATAPAVDNQRLPGMRILVVDDSDINREVALRILQAEGAHVELANDGASALAWLCANRDAVDIVLMDVQMPGMDGYEATRRLRDTQACRTLPVIALTAGAFKNHQDAARAAGMDAFVAKPFNVDELIATIQRLTKGQSAGAAPAAGAAPQGEPDVWPGIALRQALATWREESAYRTFLRKFASDYGRAGAQLEAWYAQGETAAAAAQVHKLKGGAASLSLPDVAHTAGELELAEHEGGDIAAALRALQDALAVACASIVAYASAAGADAPPQQAAAGGDAAALLRELLLALDTDAPDRAIALLDQLAPLIAAAKVAQLRNRIDDFDFRGAEALALSLIMEPGLELEE
jgi:signal transduction histidine kinase/DNA-binding response OmpR family regulator/HPt (histidine-containing phosphotransfer) domain-containing protein